MMETDFPGFPGRLGLLLLLALGVALPAQAASEAGHRCLYVSSYHAGYEWNDGIERGLDAVLAGQCELRRFYMDTKRHPDPAWARARAADALALIEAFRPDVLLAADDNASRYLVMPHLRDAGLPVVFCGLNWTVEEYGYPYRNATGMVEVAPLMPLLRQVRRIRPSPQRVLFLSADVATERKDLEHYRRVLARQGVRLDARLVRDFDAWRQAYREAAGYDFVILNNNAGIDGWDDFQAANFVRRTAGVLSVSVYSWMVPYVDLAITKVPEEQGEWMGQVALAIFDGLSPADIPIIPNRRWEAWVNRELTRRHGLELPHSLLLKAKELP